MTFLGFLEVSWWPSNEICGCFETAVYLGVCFVYLFIDIGVKSKYFTWDT